jgi:succinylarginine dihydrolase
VVTAAVEVNFDGLVGPTHNYAGLSHGNVASQRHRHEVANPRAAVLEGLAKMKLLAELGLVQGVLPPQDRPHVQMLRRLGFRGSDADVLAAAQREDPVLLAVCMSASSMWAANAATVSASADTADGRLHFTAANLVHELHRSMEPAFTARLLQAIFQDEARFAHHQPLPAAGHLGDEGAANHTRLCARHAQPGVCLFVFGRVALSPDSARPQRYPARQCHEASASVARLHQLRPAATLFVQQHPAAIDAGVFHNDVIAVGHRHVLLCHQRAYLDQPAVLKTLSQVFERTCGQPLQIVEVAERDLPLTDAIDTYLFNSQLVDRGAQGMALICPLECADHEGACELLRGLVQGDHPINEVHFVQLRQSMRNGGGPACLRLRVPMTSQEQAAMKPTVLWTPALHARLTTWAQQHYRESLRASELADPKLLVESRDALDELAGILDLGHIYHFQR